MADILVGNEEDYQLALEIEGPQAGGKGIKAKSMASRKWSPESRKPTPIVRFSQTHCVRFTQQTNTPRCYSQC